MTRSAATPTAPNGFVPGAICNRKAALQPDSYNEKSRTVEAVLSTGAPVKRWGIIEQLAVSPEAVDITRVPLGQVKLLDHHNRFSLEAVLGTVEDARFEDGGLVGTLRFAETEGGRAAEAMVKRGELTGISVGYQVSAWTLSRVENDVEIWQADRWELLEVSLVSVPADAHATTRTSPSETDSNRAPAHNQEDDMTRSLPAGADPAVPAAQIATPPATVAPTENNQSHSWPADDVAKINARAMAFGLDAAAAVAVMADPNVRSLDAATDKLQERAVTRQAPRNDPHIRVLQDEGDTLRRAVESAIMLRANPQVFKPDAPERELARDWRGMSLLECGRLFMEESQGVRLRGLHRLELAGMCLGMQSLGMQTRGAGMHSTSDFANLLANVAAKRLRAAYESAPQNWRRISRQSNNPDFKEKSVVQLSSAPTFKQVREGSEYSYGGLTDGVEKYALATYGRIIAITRQTLINDDLGAFDRLPTMLGRAAAELEASVFWQVFTANAALNDGVALFHANHGNLGAAGAISETTLAEGKKLMRQQKSLAAKAADREPLNIVPAVLIVSSEKEVEAQKMLTAVLAAATGEVNVFANSLELLVEARLTGNAWYLSADPAMIDTVEYAYLEGEEGVFTEQRVGFEIDGIEVKGRLDFAAKAIDYRGLFKNAGE